MTTASKLLDKNAAVVRARELRRSSTLPERLLWQVLRTRPNGFKFRRQHPIGRYVVDFYCPAARLAIEVDGQSHSMGQEPRRDATRDEWLKGQGFQVIRFAAVDVMNDLQSVVTAILFACRC